MSKYAIVEEVSDLKDASQHHHSWCHELIVGHLSKNRQDDVYKENPYTLYHHLEGTRNSLTKLTAFKLFRTFTFFSYLYIFITWKIYLF